MRLPSKIIPYSKSVISLFPEILKTLQDGDITPRDLIGPYMSDKEELGDALDALDCLYALRQIELIDGGRLIHYAGNDTL